MKRIALQIVLLALFVIFLLSGIIVVKHILDLPFRATNDSLHQNDSFIVLDFLIPAGMYIDQYMTIAEVLKIRVTKKASPFEKMLNAISQLISPTYRYLADLLLFFFWSFVFMTFLRIFTFIGYGRALRASLVMGGLSYYFMPDFSPGRIDDIIFISIAILIIILRFYTRKKKKKKIFAS